MKTMKEVMTTNVETCTPDDNVEHAAKLMKEHHIGAVPVIQENNLMGMITDRDIVVRCIAEDKTESSPVTEVMTTDIVTAEPDMDIEKAAKLMASRQIRRLPVVENQQLAGIAALKDLAVDEQTDAKASFALNEISEERQVHH
ncbi:CBS domain-containing protein [Salibacterium halotolerans]|uniref:CBS domain-containing protein n=1 Tax=Salibacterium halotolerans TaxID=1884432 RepID=A0A1I5M2J0_9BACI|nr:CBS domain-containing protein [Salibacterium halotolerans]SFP03567.1 CBS domain-containing protein [Salibacterium halotolerans]